MFTSRRSLPIHTLPLFQAELKKTRMGHMPWCQLGTQDFGLINHKIRVKSALYDHNARPSQVTALLSPNLHLKCIYHGGTKWQIHPVWPTSWGHRCQHVITPFWVNQDGTKCNWFTQRLAILHTQTYYWTCIWQRKLGHNDLLHWVLGHHSKNSFVHYLCNQLSWSGSGTWIGFDAPGT